MIKTDLSIYMDWFSDGYLIGYIPEGISESGAVELIITDNKYNEILSVSTGIKAHDIETILKHFGFKKRGK